MNKKAKTTCIIFTILLLSATLLLYLYRMQDTSEAGLLFARLTKGNQIRAIIVCGVLFAYGWLITDIWAAGMPPFLKMISCFPIALTVWCLSSMCLLILGLPYRLYTASFVMLCLLFLSFILNRKNRAPHAFHLKEAQEFMLCLCLFIAIAAFFSSGFFNHYMDYDSYYYIFEWGKQLAKNGKFTQDYSYLLFHTSAFPATVSSLAAFCNIENIYAFHHCLLFGFWGQFAYFCFQQLNVGSKRFPVSMTAALLITGFVYFLPPVHFETGLLLSHTYQMVLSFPLIMMLWNTKNKERLAGSEKALLVLLILSFTLLRADSPITLCVILFCFLSCGYKDKRFLVRMTLYSMAVLVLYYIRIFRLCGVQENNFIQPFTVVMILALYIGIILYTVFMIFFGNRKVFQYMDMICYGLIFLFNIGLRLIFKIVFYENFLVIYRNATETDELWGATFWVLLLMLLYAFLRKEKSDALLMVGIFTLLIGADLGVLRTLTGSHMARLGWGDSMNRYIWSFLPFVIGQGLIKLVNNICQNKQLKAKETERI